MRLLLLTPLAMTLGLLELVAASSAHTKQVCYTRQGSKPVKHLHASYTTKTNYAQPNEVCLTTYATSTATPPPTTTTLTAISTLTVYVTDSTITDIFSTTSTILVTSTETDTSTTTQTSTTSATATATITSTVSAPAGFTPIQSSTATPASRRNLAAARIEEDALVLRSEQQGGCRGKSYPQSVTCKVQVVVKPKAITKTIQGPPKTVTAAPKTSTSTTTSTLTTTSTSVPANVLTTISFSTTETITTTTIEMATAVTTTTSTATSTATVNALGACSSDNFVGANNVFNAGANAASIYTTSSATSAYDCCSQCQAMSTCSGSAFSGTTCILLQNNACPANGAANGVAGFYTGTSPFMVSNGACYTYYSSS